MDNRIKRFKTDLIRDLEVENLGNARMMNILGNNFFKILDYIYFDILVYLVLFFLDCVWWELGFMFGLFRMFFYLE